MSLKIFIRGALELLLLQRHLSASPEAMPRSMALGALPLETQSGYQNIISNLVDFLDWWGCTDPRSTSCPVSHSSPTADHLVSLFSAHPSALHPFVLYQKPKDTG